MSFAQSLKEYLFHGARNKENNPTSANNSVVPTKKKTPTVCQKPKTNLKTTTCNLPNLPHYNNMDQSLAVVGQEIKDLGLSKKLNAHKVKKALAFDKNPQELKKDSSKEKLPMPVQANVKVTQKSSTMPYLGKNGVKSQGAYWDPKKNLGETDGSGEEQLSTEEHSANSPAIVVDAPSEKSSGRAGENWAKEVEAKDQRNKMVRVYAKDIIQTLKEKDAKTRIQYCLESHKISASLRAKMVDWMIEVLCSYKCSNQTFFLAVRIMDAYFKKTQTVHSTSDLHAVGVTTMFIASKFEEIYPMRLSILYEKVGHKKLTIEEILQKEGEILSVLGFNLVNVTAYEFVTNVLFQLGLKETMNKDLYDYLQRVCVYLSKANMYDYELISQYSSCELAACTLFVAFKVTEQVDSTFPVATMVDAVCEILGVEDEVLYTCATKILNLAKNFEKLFPSFKNLKKFHSIGAPGKNNSSEDAIAANNSTTTPSA